MVHPMQTFRSGVLAAAGLLALSLGLACGGGGSTGTYTTSAPTSIEIQDAPSDAWSTVQVQVTQVTLYQQGNHAVTTVPFSGAATVNLIDLDGLGELLAANAVPLGTYDQAMITLNPDPSTMTLIPEGSATAVPASRIQVIGGSTVTVDLSASPLTVARTPAAGSNALQLDFDLANPMFINETSDGSVVVDFAVRPTAAPAALHLIQLHRAVGTVASVNAATGALGVTKAGQTLTFGTDSSTLFYDVDGTTSGSALAPDGNGIADVAAGDAVMIAARLQDDGTLYAVRVWFCSAAEAASLPLSRWSPEGHVVSVNPSADTLIVDNADGNQRHVAITADTTFTYQRSTVLAGPAAATSALAFFGTTGNLRHGFKISVDVVNPLASPLVASSVNIERAVDSGYLDSSTSTSDLVYGQTLLNNLRSYPYASSFTWWNYEEPSAASSSVADFVAALAGADGLRATGASDLAWNSTTSAWNATTAILLPVPLPVATLTQGYTAGASGTGTLQVSYTDPVTNQTVTTTVVLTSASGGDQTVVLKVTPQSAGGFAAALDPATAWATDLTPSATGAWLTVLPQASGNPLVYSVVVLEPAS